MDTETPQQINNRKWAAYHFGACDDGSIAPDEAVWNLETVPIELLSPLYPEGAKHFIDAEIENRREEYGRDPHYCDFLSAPDFEQYLADNCEGPCVMSVDNDGVIQIWDGWHRIACAIVRGEPAIGVLVGRAYQSRATPATRGVPGL